MKTPFVFGRIAKEDNFADRIEETAHLVTNFKSLVNTAIISPRRWGKSSLVYKASQIAMADESDLKICFVDLFNVRSENQFYLALARSVVNATSGRWEEAIETATRFLTRFVPKISIGTDPTQGISLELNIEELKRDPDDILDLARKIAEQKKLRIVICIDEFQNISEFSDPLAFQRKLRSHWQQTENVSYCLYGSKRHMMLQVFADYSMPFYKFGEIILLDKIPVDEWIPFISGTFTKTGKTISEGQCRAVISLAGNHPYYVQQLSQQVWLRTDRVVKDEVINEAHRDIISQLSLLFDIITQTLSNQQICLLNAMSASETEMSSQRVMSKYGITSTSMVARARKALVEKDILDNMSGSYSFQDPMYAYWLKHCYFRQ